jgi:serine/threonine protein kinase/tetratricopeptide (TPR) repeat protein
LVAADAPSKCGDGDDNAASVIQRAGKATMHPDKWQTVKQVFDEVVDLPPAERAHRLERLCDHDPEIRSEVETLLHAAEHTGGNGVTAEPQRRSEVTSRADRSDRQDISTGPYVLLEPIGDGGFGTVWLAEQRSPVQRQVALKILKLGMDTRQIIARFEAERQALAMMDHPNIARVFDAGTTDSGRPYFVMELVRGVPITHYCDQYNLDIRQRLELLIPVCQAVQHAHQKGIIHRDIKPSNVLVAIQDGLPVPKVIDFGIAKAISKRLTDKTVHTEVNQMIGTPEYMSPEQARMSAMDIDTRADIYSMGVLMYELLTGVTPFDTRTLRLAAYDEMQRMIREVEPPRPSTRLSALEALPSVAAARRIDPRRLSQLLRGELDWIVMKCLEKDRTRRYETADALRSDITRYLSDQPVQAGPPSTTYKLRKFVRRNRPAVVSAAIALLAATVGIAFYVYSIRAEQLRTQLALADAQRQKLEAETQRANAQSQERQAKHQADIAQAVERFLSNMLASADPQRMFGEKVTVVQAVTAAVKELDAGKLSHQPLVEAAVRDTIGNTLRALGQYGAAEPNLIKALELRRGSLPESHPLLAASLNNLARLKRAQGKLGDAEQLFRQSLEMNRRILSPSDPDLAASINNVAVIVYSTGRASEAEALLREALQVCRAGLPPGHPDTAAAINNLSAVIQAQGDLARAEPLLHEALELMRAARPQGHPDIALPLNNLASLLCEQGKFAQAEPLLREALSISRATMPAVHPDVALAINNLAMAQLELGQLAQAEAGFRESLSMRQRLLSADHPDIAISVGNLSQALGAQQKFPEAETLARQAVEIRKRALPATHPDIAVSLNNLGALLWQQKKLEEAETVLHEALNLLVRTLPTDHPSIATAKTNLGLMLQDAGKLADAEKLLADALEKRRAKLGVESELTQQTAIALARLFDQLNRSAEAQELLNQYRRASTLPASNPAER